MDKEKQSTSTLSSSAQQQQRHQQQEQQFYATRCASDVINLFFPPGNMAVPREGKTHRQVLNEVGMHWAKQGLTPARVSYRATADNKWICTVGFDELPDIVYESLSGQLSKMDAKESACRWLFVDMDRIIRGCSGLGTSDIDGGTKSLLWTVSFRVDEKQFARALDKAVQLAGECDLGLTRSSPTNLVLPGAWADAVMGEALLARK